MWVHDKDDDIGEDAARSSAVRLCTAQVSVASSVGDTVREVVASYLSGVSLLFWLWVCVFCLSRRGLFFAIDSEIDGEECLFSPLEVDDDNLGSIIQKQSQGLLA